MYSLSDSVKSKSDIEVVSGIFDVWGFAMH